MSENKNNPIELSLDDLNIDWGHGSPTKETSNTFVGSDPNNFYKRNLQFLSGQNSAAEKENVKRPVFRLAFLLNSGKNSFAKAVHVANATNPAEIDNVPTDYYNITCPDNLNNLSVFFLDFTFTWYVDADGKDWLSPTWVNNVFTESKFSQVQPQAPAGRQRPGYRPQAVLPQTMKCFHLRPYGTPKNKSLYSDNNQLATKFWQELLPSFDVDPEKYSTIYTIWFHKKYFGYNIIEQIFQDTGFSEQVKYLKDHCLHKKIIDMFELSDLISKNDLIAKRGDIFLLFTKWLNYKNTAMVTVSDEYNKKHFETNSTSVIDINFFKRLDDFFFYSVKCFINLIDQCLYENKINVTGAKGIVLSDFFEKDYALGGTGQTPTGHKVEFEDEDLEDELAEAPQAPSDESEDESQDEEESDEEDNSDDSEDSDVEVEVDEQEEKPKKSSSNKKSTKKVSKKTTSKKPTKKPSKKTSVKKPAKKATKKGAKN